MFSPNIGFLQIQIQTDLWFQNWVISTYELTYLNCVATDGRGFDFSYNFSRSFKLQIIIHQLGTQKSE